MQYKQGHAVYHLVSSFGVVSLEVLGNWSTDTHLVEAANKEASTGTNTKAWLFLSIS
jgi:hypothetical protein